ncbi:MAG: FAD-dependent oxidoreductase [Bdellovibrionaceae bacterium]|nr:FAD-dependent oxidoreductase [Pseudobdellovibrionaceae bacterium]
MSAIHPGETRSLWQDAEAETHIGALTHDFNVDVCVIGGGIAGLTTAYLLQKEGKRVCVLEDFEIASGQSGRTTAQFVTALDERYVNLERYHGARGAEMAADSHSEAIEFVRKIVEDESIDCEMRFVDGYLFADGGHERLLEDELEACHRAGLFEVERLATSPVPSMSEGPCLRFPNQLQLHPVKYLNALANKFEERGGRIFTRTRAVEVRGGEDAYVKTQEGHTVQAQAIVVATNSPVNDLFAIHTKQAPYRSYVIGVKVPAGTVREGFYWDSEEPFHYVRLEAGPRDADPGLMELDYDILIVGGEDHKTGQDQDPEARFTRLLEWTRAKFPQSTDLLYRWSGQVMQSMDGVGFLGHNPMDRDNVYVITGDSGNGMTHGTIGAMLITDQIMGRPNVWETLYNPSRVSLRATGRFLLENVNVAAQYVDWFTPKGDPDFANLPAGEGVVVREGLKMIAAYKNDDGNMELMSAVCPHLAGIVQWNTVEKSWDCPCHGSRFDCHGKVIEGPAFQDLRPHVELTEPPLTEVEFRTRPLLTPAPEF